jgi:hypothetical protein
MTNLAHRSRLVAVNAAVAALITFGFAVFPPVALAQEATTTFTVSLESLAPGVPQSITETFSLDESAKLVGFAWVERSGVLAEDTAEIEVTICGSEGQCVDPASPGAVVFEAGTMQAVLEVTLSESAAEGEAGSAVGELQFAQVVDDLPFTGLEATRLLVWGVAAVSIGAFVVRLARQTREERS